MGKKSKKLKNEEINELAADEQTLQEENLSENEEVKENLETELVETEPEEESLEKPISKKEAKKQARKEKEEQELAKELEKEQNAKNKKSAKKAAKKEKNANKKATKKIAHKENNRPKWVKAFFKKNQGKSQNLMFEYMEKDHYRLLKRAHALLDITDKDYEKLFMIKMPDSFDNVHKVNYRLDINKEGKNTLLYDQAYINVLFFGEDTLYNYHANIDYNTGSIGFDGTTSFHYFDIVSIETKLAYDDPTNPKYSQFYIILNLSNNQQVTLNLRNHRLNASYQLPSLLTVQEERIIKLLREKMQK